MLGYLKKKKEWDNLIESWDGQKWQIEGLLRNLWGEPYIVGKIRIKWNQGLWYSQIP